MKFTAATLAIAALTLTGVAQAGPLGHDLKRDAAQQARIAQGVRSGELTRGETARLEAGQVRVDRTEARAAADGHVGAAEQAHIERLQDRQSRHIRRLKHNGREAG